jgi:quercetin dioxygenase-like cupin family protein
MRKNPPRNLLPVAALAAAALAVTSTYAQPGSDRESDDAHAASTDTAAASDAAAADARVTPLLTEPLVGIPGKEVSISVVEYAPGGASPPHRHNANVFVYVLDGEVEMQVAGGERVTLTEGETFREVPADIHTVSRNASSTRPARFLAILVKDEGAPATEPAD